jgi:hypothetical protein
LVKIAVGRFSAITTLLDDLKMDQTTMNKTLSMLFLSSVAAFWVLATEMALSYPNAKDWGNAYKNSDLVALKIHLGNQCISNNYGKQPKKIRIPGRAPIIGIGAVIAPLIFKPKDTTVGVHIVPYVIVRSRSNHRKLPLYLVPEVQNLRKVKFDEFYSTCLERYNQQVAYKYLKYYPLVLLRVDNQANRKKLEKHLKRKKWATFFWYKSATKKSVGTMRDLLRLVFKKKQAQFLKGLPFDVHVELIDESKGENNHLKFCVPKKGFFKCNSAENRHIEGSCANFDFSRLMEADGTIDTTQSVRVLRHNAPLYPAANSQHSKKHLRFGDSLLPTRVSTRHKRVQVRKEGIRTPIGWMQGYDLLCAVEPLKSDNGLDRKVFIKTPTSEDPSLSTVPAYPTYEGECYGHCKQLSGFRLYFIFANDKDNKRYLVVDKHTLGEDPPPVLTGWIDSDRGIPWNTTLGMRPKEGIKEVRLEPKNPDKRGQSGVILSGGNIWYKLPLRIPILAIDRTEQRYSVAAPSIGMQGLELYKEDILAYILAPMKQVDVFFLIDGTAGMSPYIKAVKLAAQDIADQLRQEPDFKETSLRFGFRVYRDTYADSIRKNGQQICWGGICEGLPLSATTCRPNDSDTQANLEKFIQQIDRVEEISSQNDYSKQLFDGLRQAIQDMTPCPKRTKLLFVIGEHGDRQDEVPQDIVNAFNDSFERKAIYFIQTPNNIYKARTPSAYRKPYLGYRSQALQLLDKVLPREVKGKPVARTDYFFSLNQTQLTEKVIEQVKQYSSRVVINELEAVLAAAGRESLQNALDKNLKANKIPILYWQWIDEVCNTRFKEPCEKVIYNRVTEFELPIDKTKIQEEIWMTASDLDDWLSLLRPFENVLKGYYRTRTQRKMFVKLLRKQIQEIVGGFPEETVPMSEWLATQHKRALPMREDSPLLQYSFKELREIERCELKRLAKWVTDIRTVLQRVYNNSTHKVNFTLKYPATTCPLSEKGKKVPKLKFGTTQALGPDDTYRYDHTLYNQTVYWLPVDFLP